MMIDLDPQIAQMFHQSTAVSSKYFCLPISVAQSNLFLTLHRSIKGYQCSHVKAGSKRRRTQAQINGARHENEIMELLQNEE